MDINLSKYLQKDYSCSQLIPIALDAAAQVHNASVSGAEKLKKVQEALSEFIKALPVEDDKKKELQTFVHDVLPFALDAAIRVSRGQFKPSKQCVKSLWVACYSTAKPEIPAVVKPTETIVPSA